MSSNSSAESSPIVSRDRVIDVLRTELRIATTVERRFTVEQIANASGVSVRTIRTYMANDPGEAREACLSNALSIALILGRRAVKALVALIGYTAEPIDEQDVDCPRQSGVAALQGLTVFIAAAADGRIDHTEAGAVRQSVDLVIAELQPWSTPGGAE